MRKRIEVSLLLAGLVVLAMFFAGCSGNTSQGTTTTVPTTPLVQAKFIAGDIIARTATSADTFWLIVKYDAKTDKYERALAYKKSDGSWYRKDAKTELYDRSLMEKLYPAKIAHVPSLSDVPLATPTATTAPTTTRVTTTTTALVSAPTVTGITPGSGMAGTTVNITGITGTNFRFGATVRLLRGTYSITGAGVSVISETTITCRFGIPPSAETGAWNVTVINPDGQSGTLVNGFTITNTTTTTQPTTTATTAPPAPTVSSISPSSATTGITINITSLAGSNLLNVTSVKLTKVGQPDISATNVTVVSAAQVICTINLASAATGQWNVMVANSGGQSGIGTDLFTVMNPPPPIVAFFGAPPAGVHPLLVTFSDLSTRNPTTWSWIFGDIGAGNTSILQNPSHTYTTAGTYSVKLTVTNAGGSNTTTLSNYIIVN